MRNIKSLIFTILICIICVLPILDFKKNTNESVETLYKVYLNGSSIGVIKSKDKLEEYINEEQKDIKEKYNVDNVYIPTSLYISEYTSSNANIISEEDIYSKIKETESFTVKGYVINIKTDDEDISINVLNKEDFTNAVNNVVKAFVSEEDLNVFLSGNTVKIDYTGRRVEDLYIKENITITESYIPTNEKIYINEKEITKYLLFGDNTEEKTYVVKAGDSIETIALDNQLAVEELLVVNQNLKNENSILSVGEEISVALISPVITVVENEYVVEEQVIKYTTVVEYDNTKIAGSVTIKQEGKDGLDLVTRKVIYENGDAVNAIVSNAEVITESINEIKVIGTMSVATINESDLPDIGDWYWPTEKNYWISSNYGWRWGSLHEGVDITGTGFGSPIYAANNGIVFKVWWDDIGGYQIMIRHAENYYTWYAHLQSQIVSAGDTVVRGQKIGTMGSTGQSTGPHLHFGTYIGRPSYGGVSFNPLTLYR